MVELAPKLSVFFILVYSEGKRVFFHRQLDGQSRFCRVQKKEDDIALSILVGLYFDQYNGNLAIALERGWVTPFGKVTPAGFLEAERWKVFRREAKKELYDALCEFG